MGKRERQRFRRTFRRNARRNLPAQPLQQSHATQRNIRPDCCSNATDSQHKNAAAGLHATAVSVRHVGDPALLMRAKTRSGALWAERVEPKSYCCQSVTQAGGTSAHALTLATDTNLGYETEGVWEQGAVGVEHILGTKIAKSAKHLQPYSSRIPFGVLLSPLVPRQPGGTPSYTNGTC